MSLHRYTQEQQSKQWQQQQEQHNKQHAEQVEKLRGKAVAG